MSEAIIAHSASVIRFAWPDEYVQVLVSRIHDGRDGQISADVRFTTTAPGEQGGLLHQSRMRLDSMRARQDVLKVLAKRYEEADWYALLEQVCYHALELSRVGEPAIELSTAIEYSPPQYLLYPILPKDQPTIIFGYGGTGKSYLALAFGMLIQLPWPDNPLGLETAEKTTPVLYCDWETDDPGIGWRMRCLKRGFELPDLALHYRRCTRSLADDAEALERIVLEHKIGCIIVDSIGPAAGGNLKDPEAAIRLFTALRGLKATSLLVAHRAKDQGDGRDATPFGSAFFINLARSVWEVKTSQHEGEDTIHVGLWHRKSNMSRLHKPLGFSISFGAEMVCLREHDLSKVSDLLEHLSQPQQIRAALQNDRLTKEEIAEVIKTKPKTAGEVLRRMVKAGTLATDGVTWWVPVRREEEA